MLRDCKVTLNFSHNVQKGSYQASLSVKSLNIGNIYVTG